MNKFRNPLSFAGKRPSREELQEYLKNVSSFDRRGNAHPRTILDKKGDPVSVQEFMTVNLGLTLRQFRHVNTKECWIMLNYRDWKAGQSDSRTQRFKDAKNAADAECIRNGENPKKWETIATILT